MDFHLDTQYLITNNRYRTNNKTSTAIRRQIVCMKERKEMFEKALTVLSARVSFGIS